MLHPSHRGVRCRRRRDGGVLAQTVLLPSLLIPIHPLLKSYRYLLALTVHFKLFLDQLQKNLQLVLLLIPSGDLEKAAKTFIWSFQWVQGSNTA